MSSFWGGDLGIWATAHRIVTGGAGVGGTVGLSSWLDPDDGIDVLVSSVGGWAETETGTLDVAPVAPSRADVLDTRTALVDDELSVPSLGAEHRSKGVDVVGLVVVRVALGGWVGRGSSEGVVVGNVGSETTDEGALATVGPHRDEEISSGRDVGWPAEPSGVTGIHVHVDASSGEGLEGIGGGRLVTISGSRAAWVAQVGDQVGQRVGLNDSNDGRAWVPLDRSGNTIDIALVLGGTTLIEEELSVRGVGVAITVGQVIDDELEDFARSSWEIVVEGSNLGDGIEPGEGRDLLDLEDLGLEGRVRDLISSAVDLGSVVGREPDSLAREGIASGSRDDGRAAGGCSRSRSAAGRAARRRSATGRATRRSATARGAGARRRAARRG